jgi:F0F1-type ATP synthase membrane subunit b/b'
MAVVFASDTSHHIDKMIATLRQKAQHEKESLTKTLADYKQQLEKAKEKFINRFLHIGYCMALVFTSDTSHANGNITVVTNKNTVLFVLITSQFYFRDTDKMIATLRQNAQHEKESLTKTLADYKQQLEKAKEIEKREHKTQQSRDDASFPF